MTSPARRAHALLSGPVPLLIALAGYCVAVGLVHWNRPARADVIILVLRYALVLPVLVFFIRNRRGAGESRWKLPPVRLQAAVFVLVAAPLAWYWGRGQTVSDESGYRFQARLFASGTIAAEAPPIRLDAFPRVRNNEIPFAGDILYAGRWFSKYPPGWPAVLALAEQLRAGWLASLLLSGGILVLTGTLAKLAFDRTTARLAVLLSIASPYFLYNSMGYLSHPLCGVLVAAAAYFCLAGIRGRSRAAFWAMFAALAMAAQVRPFTAFCVGLVLGPCALWAVRKERAMAAAVLSAGIVCGACAIGGAAIYNHALTGSYWRSTYALARGTNIPIEVTPSLKVLSRNLQYERRWSVEATAIFTFPFLFLTAAWCTLQEARRRTEVAVPALLFAVVAAGYLIQPESSTCPYGERYYFEVFFAAAILAARGIVLIAQSGPGSARAISHALVGLLAAQGCVFVVCTPIMAGHTRYFAQVGEAFARVTSPGTVVFVPDVSAEDYLDNARNFNPNPADWRKAPAVYLPDPGEANRDEETRRLGRSRWILLRKDGGSDAVVQALAKSLD